ncbi:ST8SIA1 [Branchiostoma lanceolatum]|uniref:ST8SIA1 protein n=1 Tax=Branchiostoma lanceolatum TaxID=7740 RepID=A0A8J9ZVB3_BRALA|nr:ST8SIA1 [Branchiostoma lanceolatum]
MPRMEENPFNARRFNTCSIVGNGGILKGNGCGKEIDASEFVFRCNLAPMDSAYRKDIGEKTSLVTMNPSMLAYRYHAFAKGSRWFEKSKKDRKAFIEDLSVYGDSFIWIGAFFTRTYELVFKTQDVLLEGKAKQKVVIAHPDFVRSVHSFWKENGLKAGRASTGIILVSAASQMCEEVHLYGFWPFHSDRKSRRLTEHYYDNALSTKYHSIPDEFKQLQHLHNTGVLRLTTTACQSEINADN